MEQPIEVRIGQYLKELGLTLAAAESCTGGLVGSRLTDVAGSSEYFLGGVVAYSNDAKLKLLRVQRKTLVQHGAVSEQTALEMAAGVRRAFGADIGLAVTGIAGPGGATKDKPVGLIWLALDAKEHSQAKSLHLSGNRLENKAGAAGQILTLLEEYLVPLLPDR
jgi:nicotinamide-nucleotide amidase